MAASPVFTATGITGATLPSRHVGATTSGAPTYGAFEVGDFVIDRSGATWVCTAAGQPGTWASALPSAGGTMSGAIAMGSNKITGLANGSAAQDAAAFGQVLARQATTGTTGYALVNGTGNIITWAVPNDGNLHTLLIIATLHVTVNEVGGQLAVSWTLPDNTSFLSNFLSASAAAGVAPTVFTATVKAGATIALTQNTALTGGTATVWAEIWGA